MQYVEWGLWILAAVVALGSASGLRGMVRAGTIPTRMTVNVVMLLWVGLVSAFLLGLSPFHLLWWYPLAYVLGMASLAVPFSLLNIPGHIFGLFCFLGLDLTDGTARSSPPAPAGPPGEQEAIGPDLWAMAGMGMAETHFEQLEKRFPHSSDGQKGLVLMELYRAYFAAVSLHASRYLKDSASLNQFGAQMLSFLAKPEKAGQAAHAFADHEAVDAAVVAYCQGRLTAAETKEVDGWRGILGVPKDSGPILQLCLLVHARLCHILGISRADPTFLDLWTVNGTIPSQGLSAILGRYQPSL